MFTCKCGKIVAHKGIKLLGMCFQRLLQYQSRCSQRFDSRHARFVTDVKLIVMKTPAMAPVADAIQNCRRC